MKSTGHEKVRVTVCLATKGDGTKCKSFIVFAGAKRECKSLHDMNTNGNALLLAYPMAG